MAENIIIQLPKKRKKTCKKNSVFMFTVLCWAEFMAVLDHMGPLT